MSFMGKIKDLFAKKKRGRRLRRISVDKRFALIGRTGQGSMSKVWRARDRETGKTLVYNPVVLRVTNLMKN